MLRSVAPLFIPLRYSGTSPARLSVPCDAFLLLLVSCWILTPIPAYSWWETGHETIARIAAAHLTPAARTRIARILDVSDTPEAIADALAKASIWADQTKKETKTGEWHYIDLALQDHKSDIAARCQDDNCAPARIRLFAAQLASRTSERKVERSRCPALSRPFRRRHSPASARHFRRRSGRKLRTTRPAGRQSEEPAFALGWRNRQRNQPRRQGARWRISRRKSQTLSPDATAE